MIPSALPTISARSAFSAQSAFGPLAWNLLYYELEEEAKTDFNTRPTTIAGAVIQPVPVFQFGSQSSGFWFMVVADITDPTTFSPSLALQDFPGERYLNFVNPTFIQDLEHLQVPGFFSDGVPGPLP